MGASGTILHTTDGGMNWASQTSGTSEHLRTVTFMPAAVAVSEPATFALFLLGLLALAIPALRRSV